MLTKLATFRGLSNDGEPLVRLFHPGESLVKVAGELMPQIREWLNGYKPNPEELCLLVNAMGASEYWGQNINGDIFNEDALVHDCRQHAGQQHSYDDFTGKTVPPYGYWTFLHALPFVHHKNKDATRAFGKVAFAAWNPRMHRVELIVIIDKNLALQHGAQGIVDRILAGEYPDVSMGCRVPYDVCAVCHNKSKTRDDYCSCVKEIGMGKILDDGRRIGVINLYPRFFDISFVFIGADKTAKVMAKLASGLWVPLSVFEADELYDVRSACGARDCRECRGGCKVKAASVKKASLADSMMELRESPGRWVSKKQLEELAQASATNNALKDSELREHTSLFPPHQVPPPDPMDGGLLMGKVDNQESPQGLRSDGLLRTNYSRAEEEKLSGALNVVGRVYELKGHPDLMNRLDKLLETMQYLGNWGASRELKVGVDGDGPERLKILSGPKMQIDKHDLNQAINASVVNVNVLKEKEAAEWEDVRQPPGMAALFSSAAKIPIGPPPVPNRTKYPFIGTIKFRGLRVDVENKPGDIREGMSSGGKKWRTEMKLPYGEILGTKGHDGDKVDVYVGPYTDAPNVYIVHQNKVEGPQAGKYDEDKVMIGFRSPEEAKAAYLAHYDKPEFFRSITIMAFPLFKRVVFDGEVKGEKVAECLHKVAMELHLEDLFSCASTARRRQRTWREEATGKERNVTGSGLKEEEQEAEKRKEASVKTREPLTVTELCKLASDDKVAAQAKWAELTKQISPSKAVGKVSPLLSAAEPDLPKDVLDSMGREPDLRKSLATMSIMGMVLKPREFQHMALSRMGKGDLANDLDDGGVEFEPSEEEVAPCGSLSPLQIDPRILNMLLPFLEERSYLGPVVQRRLGRLETQKPTEPPVKEQPTKVKSALLSKVAGAYNWYRREMIKVATETPFVVPSLPVLHRHVYRLGDDSFFDKTGGVARNAALVLGSVPLTLMISAHEKGQEEKGHDLGTIDSLLANHPWVSAMGIAAGLRELLKTPKGKEIADKIFESVDALRQGMKAAK